MHLLLSPPLLRLLPWVASRVFLLDSHCSEWEVLQHRTQDLELHRLQALILLQCLGVLVLVLPAFLQHLRSVWAMSLPKLR